MRMNKFISIKELTSCLHKEQMNNNVHLDNVTTGFKQLDELIYGEALPSKLIVIGGRPAMGKTTFALNMAVKEAIDGVPVAYISTCLNERQLLSRALSIVRSASYDSSLSQRDIENSPALKFTSSPFFLYFNQDLTIDILISDLKQFVRQNDIKVVYVDYLQFIAYNEGFDDSDTIGKICFLLKKLAAEMQITIVAISELNRNLEHREGIDGKIPQLSDLRGSCVIEELADVVLMVHRPEYFGVLCDECGNDLHNLFEVIMSKNSFGHTGKVKLRFDKDSGRVCSWDDSQCLDSHKM